MSILLLFQSRYLMLSATFQNQRRTAEHLDTSLFVNNNSNIELELAVTRMNQSWQKLSSLLNKVKQNLESFSSKWEQFKSLANELLDVIYDIKKQVERSTPSVLNSSIERIKEEFERVIVSFYFPFRRIV